MQIEFPEHGEDLESIENFLERHSFPNLSELKKFLSKLSKIDRSINKTLKQKEITVASYLEGQKTLVKKLTGRCHQLEVRRDVIHLAEDAEALANSSPNRPHDAVAKEAHQLQDRIDKFVKEHRPSRTNAKFIRFARACIEKAEHHEPVVVIKEGKSKNTLSLDSFRTKESSTEHLVLAEMLYELARVVYQEKFEEFAEIFQNQFSPSQQKEIRYHLSLCGGDLALLHDSTIRLKSIQGILGYAHDLADYYMDNTPYPTIIEIHHIFQDLDFVTHLEEEDKS